MCDHTMYINTCAPPLNIFANIDLADFYFSLSCVLLFAMESCVYCRNRTNINNIKETTVFLIDANYQRIKDGNGNFVTINTKFCDNCIPAECIICNGLPKTIATCRLCNEETVNCSRYCIETHLCTSCNNSILYKLASN